MANSKSKTIKFTDEEQSKITEFNRKINASYLRLGQLKAQSESLLNQIKEADAQSLNELNQINSERDAYFKTLYDKYGDGNYDPTTGEFTPTETTG
jgi:DNA anti-recombination protein RmuC